MSRRIEPFTSRVDTIAAVVVFAAMLVPGGLLLGCSSEGGGGGGGSSTKLGQLCSKEDNSAPSSECGGGYCLIEGCTARCTTKCDPKGSDCPEGFACSNWQIDRCFPETACTQGGSECSDGFECVMYVKCDEDAASQMNIWRCVPTKLEIPAP